jgi:hypothetical protein
VDFRMLNKATKKILIFCHFFDEVFNIVTDYDAYAFLNGYSRYHQISIAFKDKYKIAFVADWGAFVGW